MDGVNEGGSAGPRTAQETAAYVSDMAHELYELCERAGLGSLATLFYASHIEARRTHDKIAKRGARWGAA